MASLFKKKADIRLTPGMSFQEIETVRVDAAGNIAERIKARIEYFIQRLPEGETIAMVKIPSGDFHMGSFPLCGQADERPLHPVRISSFFLSQCQITQSQWNALMGKPLPCRGRDIHGPADRVGWQDALSFCEKLARLSGAAYALPSESEWEYACRAGSRTDFSFGDMITTDYANYVGAHPYRDGPKGIYRHGPVPGRAFFPNAFGLYDMHGNLDEWCQDGWHDNYEGAPTTNAPWFSKENPEKVVRGGSWHDPPGLCRSAARLKLAPTENEDFVGFRIAMHG